MAQFNWTYLADNGRQYQVGLFHGDSTGHLMIYLNTKVIIIDFQVLETKTYSFFIEEELCEIEVERKAAQFAYGFKINKEVDTAHNRSRKEREKADYRKGYWIGAAFFAFILIGSLVFILAYQEQKKRLSAPFEMVEKPVRINIVKQQGDTVALAFQLEFRGQKNNFAQLVNLREIATPFPLESGDEFNLRFDHFRPYINEIDFSKITYTQLGRYRKRALDKFMLLNPNLEKQQAECLLEVAFELKGLDGLADFYYQDHSPNQSPLYNELTYKKLIRDIPFLNKAEACAIPLN
ncbi:MAG: hypothetical protein R2828_23845 [Saprospiraceae bacterium]